MKCYLKTIIPHSVFSHKLLDFHFISIMICLEVHFLDNVIFDMYFNLQLNCSQLFVKTVSLKSK